MSLLVTLVYGSLHFTLSVPPSCTLHSLLSSFHSVYEQVPMSVIPVIRSVSLSSCLSLSLSQLGLSGPLHIDLVDNTTETGKMGVAVVWGDGKRVEMNMENGDSLEKVREMIMATGMVVCDENTRLGLVFMQKEYCGETEMRETTLGNLGFCGKVGGVFRLVMKAVDEAEMKDKEYILARDAKFKVMNSVILDKIIPNKVEVSFLQNILRSLEVEIGERMKYLVCLTTLLNIVQSIAEEPKKMNARTLRCQNAKFFERVGQWRNAISFLEHFAFDLSEDPIVLTLPESREPQNWLCKRVIDLIAATIENVKLNKLIDSELQESSQSSTFLKGNDTGSINVDAETPAPNACQMEIESKSNDPHLLNSILNDLSEELVILARDTESLDNLDSVYIEAIQSLQALLKIAQNLLSSPSESCRVLKLASPIFQQRIGRYNLALRFLCECLGFSFCTEDQLVVNFNHPEAIFLRLFPQNEKSPLWIDRCIAILKRSIENLQKSFKAKRQVFLELPPVFIPANRNLVVINASKGQPNSFLPSKFATDEEIRGDSDIILSVWKEEKRKTELAEKTAFMTREMRDYIFEQQKVKYTSTLIRVQIPGNIILQLTFQAEEKILDLVNHLCSLFRANGAVSSSSFALLLPPAKKIMPIDFQNTFRSMALVPAANFRLTAIQDGLILHEAIAEQVIFADAVWVLIVRFSITA